MRLLAAGWIATSLFAPMAHAALPASDDAGLAAYDDGWQDGEVGGPGWDGTWDVSHYVGNPGSTAASDMQSSTTNGGATNIDSAGRSFHLAAGTGATVGLAPLGGVPRLEFYASSGSYLAHDADGYHVVGVQPLGQAVHCVFTLTGPDSYSLDVTPDGVSTTTTTGTLPAGGGIARIYFDVYAEAGATQDMYFNHVTVPEPAEVGMGLAGVATVAAFRRRRA